VKFKFSDSASSAAEFIPKRELERADLTFSSVDNKGGNRSRKSRISNNLEVMSDILRSNLGLSKEDFYRGSDSIGLRKDRVVRGMGYER